MVVCGVVLVVSCVVWCCPCCVFACMTCFSSYSSPFLIRGSVRMLSPMRLWVRLPVLPHRRIYRGGFTQFTREGISALGSLLLWGNSTFYSRVGSLPGVNPNPPSSPILDGMAPVCGLWQFGFRFPSQPSLAFTRYCFIQRFLCTNQSYYVQTSLRLGTSLPAFIAHSIAQYIVSHRPPCIAIYMYNTGKGNIMLKVLCSY